MLKLRFMEELSPAKNQKGDKVRLTLTDDLVVDDCLVAPRGSLLDTTVREVKKPRPFGVPGEVRLDFNALVPLGPQRLRVVMGDASHKAAEDARKRGEKGEGAIIGAGAASIAGAALLGPVGLIGGLFVRGNSIRIPEGSIAFVQTSDDVTVSAYPIPESLRIDPGMAIRQTVSGGAPEGEPTPAPADRDIIIKKNLSGQTSQPGKAPKSEDTFELPPEQGVD